MTKKISFFLFSLLSFLAQAQHDLDAPLPMDPEVIQGKLQNGITYYIRHNTEPKNRAQLRLVVNVGSVVETDDERGLAHFMEHMEFNGTEHFPKNELTSFLQKSGLKFGADLNAYTSFDETVYMLPVPTDTLANFEKYFMVLSEWANKASLDHDEIDKERGVVLEESRLGKGAQSRIRDQLIPVVLKDSKYAERLPIGTDENLKNFKYETLEAFYKKWYRPDLQAVIAVGDFDVKVVEEYIKKYFAPIPAGTKMPVREKFDIPARQGTDALVITDKEQPYTIVQLYYKHPELKELKGSDRRQKIMFSLFNSMMSTRLQELLQKADPPYQFGLTNYGGFLGDLDALTVLAVAKDGQIEKALKAVLDENQRAKRFGFTATEFERAKTQFMTQVEKMHNERDKTDSQSFTNELIHCYLDQVPMTSIDFDLDFAKTHLNGISLDEINSLISKIVTDSNRVVVLLAPEKDKENLPSEEKLIEWVNEVNNDIEAYVDDTSNEPLLKNMPIAGKVKDKKKRTDLGLTELTLSNGVKVILKPTNFKNDEILISAKSIGGSNLYADTDYDNTSISSSVAQLSGLGDFSNIQLSKYLSGKISRVSAYVGSKTEGISASSSVKDLETTLQQIYLRFTGKRYDEDAVKGFLTNQIDMVKSINETPTPEKVYRDTLNSIMGNHSFRSSPISVERVEKIDPKKALEIYAERFADADDFVFTVVGNFENEKLVPLLEKYIGSLPSKPQHEEYKDLGNHPPKGLVNAVVKKGTEDKATVSINFSGEFNKSDEEADQISALGDILNLKLIEKLREEESGVYSPRVQTSVSKYPSARYNVSVNFGCAPANVEKLTQITLNEIKKLRENGAEASDVQKYKAEEKLDIQEAMKTNRFWLSALENAYLNNEKPEKILDAERDLEKITIKSTKETARKYLSGKNIITVTLLPEN